MDLKIQKRQKHFPAYTLSYLEAKDVIQIDIDEGDKKCTFHIEIEKLRTILLESDCVKLLSIEMKPL